MSAEILFSILFIAALFIDLLFGDPRFIPHPVQGIGWLCNRFEKLFRRVAQEVFAGFLTFSFVLGVTLATVALLLFAVQSTMVLNIVVSVLLLATTVACKDLIHHSKQVYYALTKRDDIQIARQEIAKIVGRDTSQLDSEGVTRACVETVAENLVDGVTAPLFYALLFSLIPSDSLSSFSLAVIGGFFYKSINTMDSMFGYKNEQYLHFGRIAAQVDDLVNFLPARLTAGCIFVAAFILRLNWRDGIRIFFRDRLQHASPNGGHPEAAVAGCLGVQLGGDSVYFGKVVSKPTIGEHTRSLIPDDILLTNRLMLLSSVTFACCGLLVRNIFCTIL